MTKGDELERGRHRVRALVALAASSARAGLRHGVAGEHAERDRDRHGRRELGERTSDGVGEDLEMRRLPANEAAERDNGVEPSGPGERRDRGCQLERARDLIALDARARRPRPLERRVLERFGDLLVPARAHDGDARFHVGRSHPCG